jgi:hypothetical protein
MVDELFPVAASAAAISMSHESYALSILALSVVQKGLGGVGVVAMQLRDEHSSSSPNRFRMGAGLFPPEDPRALFSEICAVLA